MDFENVVAAERAPTNVTETPRAEPAIEPIPLPNLSEAHLVHRWTFDDLYSRATGGAAITTKPSPSVVSVHLPLRWSLSEDHPLIFVQVAPDPNFTRPLNLTTNDHDRSPVMIPLGVGHLRISTDHQAWSPALTFDVRAEYALAPAPALRFDQDQITLDHNLGWVTARAQMKPGDKGVIFQYGADVNAPATQWSSDGQLRIAVEREGTLSVRAQSVSASEELSAFSEARTLRIEAPPAAARPHRVSRYLAGAG